MEEKIEIRKVRDFGEIIGDTFIFLSRNFKKLFKSLLFIVLPFNIIGTTALAYFQYNFIGSFSNKNVLGGYNWDSLISSGWSYLLTIVISIISYTFSISVTYRFITLYEKGEDYDVKELWEYAKKDFFKVLFANIGIFFLVIVGVILCFLPGIYIGVVLSLIFPIMLTENIGFSASLSRSFKLISNNWWLTFALIFVIAIIQGIIAYTFILPAMIFGGISNIFSVNNTDGLMSFQIITTVVSHLVSTFTQPILITALALHYFSLVEKKESVGILRRIDTIGNNPSGSITDPDETETY